MCAVRALIRANTFVILNQTIVPYINFSHILFPAKFSTAHYLQIHILSHDYLSQRVAVVTAINVQIMFPESQPNSCILFVSLSLAYLRCVSLSITLFQTHYEFSHSNTIRFPHTSNDGFPLPNVSLLRKTRQKSMISPSE